MDDLELPAPRDAALEHAAEIRALGKRAYTKITRSL